MEIHKVSRDDEPCNKENNPVLRRWEEVAGARGREPAVLAPDGTVLRTFCCIEEEAKRWTDRLAGQSDAETVALQIGNRAEWPALLLAIWRSGRALLPIELEMADEQRMRVEGLCAASVRIVAADRELSAALAGGAEKSLRPEGELFKLTSGTTAQPRAIRFRANQLLADCDNICETMGLRENDRNYGIVSFAHSYGFSNLITPLLCRGISLVAAADIMPRAIVDGVKASSATVLPGVPAIFRSLAEIAADGQKLRLCISAGAPLTSEVARRFFERWHLKIHSFYGASECGGICYDSSESPDIPSGYVGPPLKGVDLALESEEPSTAWVRSGAVGTGYWPVVEDGHFTNGAFRPSDLLVRHGRGYVIAGRISDVINVAGRKVNPGEVERVLRMSPQVREAVVLGLPARARGEEVAACIEGAANETDLRLLCARNLATWQVPRRWFFFDEIPRSARGKISREELRARLIRD